MISLGAPRMKRHQYAASLPSLVGLTIRFHLPEVKQR